MADPAPRLLQKLVTGSSLVSRVLWLDEVTSTNALVAERARVGEPEGLLVLADVQTTGRGRHGRRWQAPTGSSLMLSLLLRPQVEIALLPLLPLLVGLSVLEAAERRVPGVPLALKWPNDLLAGGHKTAGILVESPATQVAIVGIGINVDWRGIARPPELEQATSLSEAAARSVDRWRLLPDLVDVLDRRYRAWGRDPHAFLDAYRARCTTLGQRVRATRPSAGPVTGVATAIDEHGGLQVAVDDDLSVSLRAGDVEHLRPS